MKKNFFCAPLRNFLFEKEKNCHNSYNEWVPTGLCCCVCSGVKYYNLCVTQNHTQVVLLWGCCIVYTRKKSAFVNGVHIKRVLYTCI